jgi:hypothetical protein
MTTTLASLIAAGEPVDPDVVSLLEAEGHDTVESVRDAGRTHWITFFADRDGYTRDFVELLEGYGLSWEDAATAEPFQCSPEELEIGVPAMMIAGSFGAENFGDVFLRSPDEVRLAMAQRSGMLAELDALVDRIGGW